MMDEKTLRWFGKRVFLLTAVLGLSMATVINARSETVYNFTESLDYTGPFANVMDSQHGGRVAIVNWWNDTQGKKLGVRVDLKGYDMRYDPSVVAREWPSILNRDKPIAYLGSGAVDQNALAKRLPADKVPMILGTGTVSTVWEPNGWIFITRPTYAHEFGGLFAYLADRLPGKRPLRIGTVNTQGMSVSMDIFNGVVHLAKTYPNQFKIVNTGWVPAQPISITNEIRRIVKEKPDVILVGTNKAQVIATLRALKELGVIVPIVTSAHNGLSEVVGTIPMQDMEGSYTVCGFAPYMDERVKAVKEIFDKYNTTKKGVWGTDAIMTGNGVLLALRVLERAISRVGVTNVTGQAMYDALLAGEFPASEFMGLLQSLRFTKDAPFPTGKLMVKAIVVRNGEIVPLTDKWLPVPALSKW